jgi:hypothetical protein
VEHEILLPTFECLRCGHTWHPRNPEKPRCCAKCKSPYWDVPSLKEKKLKQAIEDAFSSDGVAAFLGSLHARCAKIHSIEIASSDLTTYLAGGAFARGDAFDVSFLSMYQALEKSAQERINEYYQSKIEQVADPVKRKFAKEFQR